MRIKVAVEDFEGGERGRYLISVPSQLKYVYDLAEYVHSRFRPEGEGNWGVSLAMGGVGLVLGEKIEDVIEDDASVE